MEARIKLFATLLILVSHATNAQWVRMDTARVDATCFTADSTALFAGTTTGVFRSTDTGKTWLQSDTGLTNKNVLAIASAHGSLFVGTNGAGIFRSSDHGTTWSEANDGLTLRALYVQSLCSSEDYLFAGTLHGTYRSSDLGGSWKGVDTSIVNDVVLSLGARENRVFAGTNGAGIRSSTDYGLTWVRADTVSAFDWERIDALALDGNILFAGTSYGTFLSTDNGANWAASDTGGFHQLVYAFAVTPRAVFSGAFFGGVRISTDGGTTWAPVNVGLTSTFVKALTAYSDTLFAGVYQSDIWCRPLSEMVPPPAPRLIEPPNSAVLYGQPFFTWHPFEGAPRYHLQCSIDSSFRANFFINDSTVYDTLRWAYPADTSFHGPWDRWFYWRVRALTANGWSSWSNQWRFYISPEDVEEREGLPVAYSLEQNYPNPFNPTTTIRYTLPHRSHVRLIVFNTLGQEVARLIDADIDAGIHDVVFDATDLASGAYFYRITASGFSQTRMLLLLR